MFRGDLKETRILNSPLLKWKKSRATLWNWTPASRPPMACGLQAGHPYPTSSRGLSKRLVSISFLDGRANHKLTLTTMSQTDKEVLSW